MTAESPIPENIQSLLDHADLSLLRGKHGEASTLSSGRLPRRL